MKKAFFILLFALLATRVSSTMAYDQYPYGSTTNTNQSSSNSWFTAPTINFFGSDSSTTPQSTYNTSTASNQTPNPFGFPDQDHVDESSTYPSY